jgi:uncharacterized protein (TIGR03435 family)
LADLIKIAYVQFAEGQHTFSPGEAQVSGGPAWIQSEHFDIDAKADQPPSPDMMRGPMLQKLLEDRFQLKIHFMTTEIPVYVLSAAKGGPKLQPADEGKCQSWEPGQPLPSAKERQAGAVPCGVFVPFRGRDDIAQIYGATIESFCRQLTALLGRNVIDRSGITGKFDIQVEIRPLSDGAPADEPGSPAAQDSAKSRGIESAIFASVAKMGLKLESGKGQGQTPVVDRAVRPEN